MEYVAGLVKVPAADFAKYSSQAGTAECHRAQVREALRFRPATLEDEEQLAVWLVGEVCPFGLVEDRQREPLLVECRTRSIEPPGTNRNEKVLIAARSRWERAFCARTIERLGEVGVARLLGIGGGRQRGRRRGAGPTRARPGRGRSGLPADVDHQAERRAQARPA